MSKTITKLLTATGIDAAPAAAKGTRDEYRDKKVGGLVLRVTDTGAKSFALYARFAFRQTTKQRIAAMGAAYEPWVHLRDIQRLLRERGHRRGVIERSVRIAALHWGVPYDTIYPYARRSAHDRRNPPRLV